MASLVLFCRGSAIQEVVGLEMGLNFTIYDTTINLWYNNIQSTSSISSSSPAYSSSLLSSFALFGSSRPFVHVFEVLLDAGFHQSGSHSLSGIVKRAIFFRAFRIGGGDGTFGCICCASSGCRGPRLGTGGTGRAYATIALSWSPATASFLRPLFISSHSKVDRSSSGCDKLSQTKFFLRFSIMSYV
jgi:hypothetical protein